MIRTFTAAEIAATYDVLLGTVYRYASTEKWRRSDDGKWPVLYNGDDVEATMERRINALQAEIARLTAELRDERKEVNALRKVVISAMTWRSTRRIMGRPPLARSRRRGEVLGYSDQALVDAVDTFMASEYSPFNSPEIAT